jgi:hypothetical protein
VAARASAIAIRVFVMVVFLIGRTSPTSTSPSHPSARRA